MHDLVRLIPPQRVAVDGASPHLRSPSGNPTVAELGYFAAVQIHLDGYTVVDDEDDDPILLDPAGVVRTTAPMRATMVDAKLNPNKMLNWAS